MTDAIAETAARPVPPVGRVGVSGMWAFLATDAMGFGALFIAYAVLRVRAPSWPDPRARLDLVPAAAMTFALLGSSFTMTWAARAERGPARGSWLLATLLLGSGFLAGQLREYHHLWRASAPLRIGPDLYASTFYALTGYHGLHVAIGLLSLLILAVSGSRRRTLEVAALYWHFVDLAWMPIFTFVYLVPAR